MDPRRHTARFDDLIEALQTEVALAQRAIDARHQERLRQVFELDGKGDGEALSCVLQVKIPGPGGERSLRVPLVTLRPYAEHRIVAASLELRAAFEEVPRPDAPPTLAASIGGNRAGRTLHRLRIALFGPQPGAGEISLDERALRRLPPPGTP